VTEIVLYRCPTRTNVLCPCGAVARRLGKLELSYRTERVPYKRASRPEIEELTRQRRVPVLVDGDEVVHDSKRIIQYLEWRYGSDDEKPKEKADGKPAAKKEAKRPERERKRRTPRPRAIRRGKERKKRAEDEDR
jgi:Glutathione S-transferase, N-terminal domain